MLVFFIILVSIIILIYLSGISVKIDNLEIVINNKIKLKDFKINIYLLLFNKIKVLKISVKKEQITKINFNKIIDRFKGKSLKRDRNIIYKSLKELKLEVKKMEIDAKIALSNTVFLAYIVALMNIVLSIIYAKIAVRYRENCRYKIESYPTNKFSLNLSINCIINLKMANIINMIIKYRSEVKNERTSNRSINGSCYE